MNLEELHDTTWEEEILSITDDSVRVRAEFNGSKVIYNIPRYPTFKETGDAGIGENTVTP